MTEIVIHELAYYSALAKKNHRGLVAMQFLQHAMPYVIGDIAGFLPKDARAMHGAGQAEPYFAPDAERPADMPVQRPEPVPDELEVARLDALDVSPTIFAENKLSRIALAKRILNVGQNTGGITADRADELIRRELTRRGTPYEDPTGGALTSNSGTGAVPPGTGTGTESSTGTE